MPEIGRLKQNASVRDSIIAKREKEQEKVKVDAPKQGTHIQ
jgi:hypothetical protein